MTDTATAYRALRAEHLDMRAIDLWRWARAPKPHAFDWDEEDGDYGSVAVGTATIDGFDVRATIADDIDYDASDTYGWFTDDYERGAFENPAWREYHKTYGRMYDHRDYCISRHEDGTARWYLSVAGDTVDDLRAYYHGRGMSRHEAHTRAVASFRECAEDARQAYADRYGQGRYAFAYVTATVSLAGVELTDAAYGGYAWERDYSKPLGPQLDAIVDDAVREALADAQPFMASIAGMEHAA